MQSPNTCPCRSSQPYQTCCSPLHQNLQQAQTCEQLMRARYSAFILQLGEYLFNTYDADFRGELTKEQLSEPSLTWVNLEIIATESLKVQGFVEFKAYYIEADTLTYHHERSNFIKKNDHWFYCDGVFYPANKSITIKRNDLCPCGSQIKYKKCKHLRE
ncbi:SecC motif-containing protein [Psychromonas sp. CNPT3]|uniref:YchJ family protein n=1 Tax=Psychromonas sp. CNPT3 TaxID=314282 RepID=UPI00006EA02D|nr:YchJ family protein [Psychromonas sp. CNPT3]AGH80597.1 SecC motif-containing protein [Psychromonas sp. CNPT3]